MLQRFTEKLTSWFTQLKPTEVIPPILVTLGGFLYYAEISLQKHVNYASTMDIGIFNQTIWGYSHFRIIPNTLSQVPNLLAEHFHPLLMILAPFEWFGHGDIILLIIQAACLAVASYPLYSFAREKLGQIPALMIQIAFLGFWGMIAGNIYDFHEIALAVPLIAFALFSLERRNNWLLWISVLLGLLSKEDMGLIFVMIGLYALIIQRRWKIGLGIIVVSSLYYYLVIKLMQSGALGATYKFWTYDALGPDPVHALAFVFRHPHRTFSMFIDQPDKRATLNITFKSWLYLPLISPLGWIGLPALAERFLSTNSAYWQPYYHYTLTISPILGFATVQVLSWIKRLMHRIKIDYYFTLLPLGLLVVGLPISGSQFTQNYQWRVLPPSTKAAYDYCINQVPPTASVVASDSLISHLSSRSQIYAMRNTSFHPDIIAIDPTMTLEVAPADLKTYIKSSLANGYGVICSRDLILILQKGAPSHPLDQAMKNYLASS